MYYVTFGYGHVHKVGEKILDSKCVLPIEANNYGEAMDKAISLFGHKFNNVQSYSPLGKEIVKL